jgi:hypothetical protein
MLSWNKKLAMWRKNHRKADGSLPSLKSAMKACKGRRVSTKKCRRRSSFRKHRKAPGQYSPKKASPKRMSPLRKANVQMRAKLSAKKQQSPAAQKKQQKPAVFGQKAPANPMFVRGTAKKQQSPAKQQKPAQKKQQSPAAQKKQQSPAAQKPAQKKQQMSFGQRAFGGPAKKQQSPAAQRKPQLGQKAQRKPAPAMRFT